ncbi:dTDP-4-amino-4,6-dideoxygalactose transaminase [Pseudoalteromonas sp. 20-MNA-CIBAN-0454]|uniref:dTDP-4-amino-4,6-dideoxygalactose transaminase n=1 Tax=Pseudoalteromonas sp. 20-MNA-CIBAN-0454 TaxID=3140424 RepID=UPI00333156BC
MNIPFNMPPVTGDELKYIETAISAGELCGGGRFSKRCQSWFESKTKTKKALMTPSCTAALEMAAILIDVQPGDEVIMPSYTFVSSSNAFVLRGAKIVFVDIRPDTMNIDEQKIELAITTKTKAIVAVHYAGVACEMDRIMQIANEFGIYVIEDAAQGVMADYKGRALGSIGHLGCYSFHETKNYTSGGEGGLLLINDEQFVERAEIIREKGTNRSLFFRGMVDKYSWVDIGSSFLPSEIQSAYLHAQLQHADTINEDRLQSWNYYYNNLCSLVEVELPVVPPDCNHNAHMFYIKLESLEERNKLIAFLKDNGVSSAFHYIPLHSSEAGKLYSRFHGQDEFTTIESERLLRLPLWYKLTDMEKDKVIDSVISYFKI